MNLLIDLGATHFRISWCNNIIKIKHSISNKNDLFDFLEKEIKKCIEKNTDNFKKIIIALPGIVKNNRLYECNNLYFLNYIDLPKKICYLNAVYINDGDLALLGELKYNNLDINKNIINLIVGTGVGSGIWCNNNIVFNSEVVFIFEKYLGGKVFDKSNMLGIKKEFIDDLSKIVELLNIDIIVLNGFIKNYNDLIISENDLNIRGFYKTKIQIIYSDCKEPVIFGGKNYDKFLMK